MALSPERQQVLQAELDRLVARLDAPELLWASGYFAGLASAGGQALPQSVPANEADAAATLTLWYGTETGNGRGVAERLAAQARAQGWAVDLASLADIQPRRITKLKLLVLVISTHGEGDPPEEAEAFYKLMTSDRAPKLDGLNFAVFALGDSSYPDFCQVGRDLDTALERAGAHRILDRVDCDVDLDASEDVWQPRILEAVTPLLEPTKATQPRLQVVRDSAIPASAAMVHGRRNPFTAELLEVSPLTVSPSAKSVHHLALSLEGSGLSYQPGDSLGVWPSHAPHLVDEILERTGLNGDEAVERGGETRPLVEWLTHRLELTQVARPFVERYAELGGVTQLAELLEDRNAFAAWCKTRQVADVIDEYPCELNADPFVSCLRAIAPRLYSIASSPLVDEDEVHLTVKLEGGETDNRLRAGAASWQLTRSLRPGDGLPVYVEANPNFRLPEGGETPVIMIGPGTGVAPFRAFVEHRAALGHGGKNWLFFGEQHRQTDFLYQLEWLRHLREGTLSRLSVAFSRDQADKVYVQHRLAEQGREVFDWLESGAHVYICGSGQGMAKDVHRALAGVIAEHAGVSAEVAEERLAEMKSAGRYKKEVY
ncbi:assimilatory sulfite reductase (NADPH) flavoprotein subunit [Ectothiorhodospira lacustris]|uniref:assimilatory sulfite reductase (NADPH) flavoprotein subunit n=1 Tax=Ectothiorhodospira lacustris TaxID=2899127 RepID=UPI001EE83B51|nr:assimilatory sulfite reductase (NADPH) flavoprotein subunit [Ectothiorhodospira lacustris]MCG5499777.1 assimilatory sulfite reductase (NADPH) flavoprotein subunit [Ectothiorhodospira lacustris]MCG5509765.1 assimilatory sulfite reductase (NADPH) flavoprotein subunit [Ectothiorhodospira lacustris]MCG5522321.1 assimilatory sulfite reductase (NADPH) flavoprotein subunit [Ectothiorhodospira lacustris]